MVNAYDLRSLVSTKGSVGHVQGAPNRPNPKTSQIATIETNTQHDLDLKGDVAKQHQRRTGPDHKHWSQAFICGIVVIYQVDRQLGDVERGMIDYPRLG
jgi:hypothetical protein